MSVIANPKFNPNLPEGSQNQRFVFDQPTVINQQTGQLNTGQVNPAPPATFTTPSGATVNTITGELLTPATPTNYNIPTYPSSLFPSVVEPTKVETPQTDAVSKLIADINATSGLAEEKIGYQLEQEKSANLEAMRKTEADYTYQYKQFENEFKNLQIEAQKVEPRMQLGARGQEITTGGLAPLTASEQRIITLKSLDVSAKANTVNALLLGTQGLIDSAQKAVDRAVNDKFAVREANRKTQLENLDLLLKDPKIDAETKAKAAATAAAVKQQGEIDDKKKEDSKTIMTWAVDIAGKVATDKTIPPGLANQIMDIARSENPDLAKAFELFSPYAQAKLTGQSDFEQAFLRDKGRLPSVEEILDYKRREAAAGTNPPAGELRDTEVSQFLQSKKGTDGYVSATDYQEGLRKFIAGGGNQTNFIASFPQQTYLRQQEIDKLPAALKPQQVTTKSDLTADQLSTINDAKAAIDQVKQRYGDWGAIRQQIIEQSKQQYGFDISPYI